MIFLYQEEKEYDYDIRATVLAFYEREKIVEVSAETFQTYVKDKELAKDNESYRKDKEEYRNQILFLKLMYSDTQIRGEFTDGEEKISKAEVTCDYKDHEHCRNAVCKMFYNMMSDYTGKTLPWGMLTGIRPTKIMMNFMEETLDKDALEKRFRETYLTDAQKSRLCRQVAFKEKDILGDHAYHKEYSLYIGIPFCPTTCLYCSFTSFPVSGFGHYMKEYLGALCRELEYVAHTYKDRTLTSIYVGGGTPTALDADSLYELMQMIHRLFPVAGIKEFTVEAGRPDSITMEKLLVLKKAGVTRISINPQTMHQSTLDLIGRRHTVEETIQAFEMGRKAGFDNINMDIITGLPGEGIEQIKETLDRIFVLKPESLTVHSLAIKRAAHLNMEMDRYRNMVKGSTNEMLRLVDDYCSNMSLEPYYMYRQKNIPGNLENIGYSLPGKECLYNILIMEEKQDIIACGAGASSKYVFHEQNRIERVENVKSLEHYIGRIDEMIERKRSFLKKHECEKNR